MGPSFPMRWDRMSMRRALGALICSTIALAAVVLVANNEQGTTARESWSGEGQYLRDDPRASLSPSDDATSFMITDGAVGREAPEDRIYERETRHPRISPRAEPRTSRRTLREEPRGWARAIGRHQDDDYTMNTMDVEDDVGSSTDVHRTPKRVGAREMDSVKKQLARLTARRHRNHVLDAPVYIETDKRKSHKKVHKPVVVKKVTKKDVKRAEKTAKAAKHAADA